MRKHLYILAAVTILSARSSAQYQKEIDDWHAKRIENLRADNGWLNLVGLFWLEEGVNKFGSSPSNKIAFPEGTIPSQAGTLQRKGNRVTLTPGVFVHILLDGQPIKGETLIYDKDSSGRPHVLAYGSLRWTIIQRDDKIGIRLRDLKSPKLESFKDIDRYPVNTAWKIPAALTTDKQQIAITNVLGQTSQQRSPGKLSFSIQGKNYTLDALDEGGDDLFIIFGDETSGKTTYPSGRFLSVKKPGPDGHTTIDFNKAYNPPCAFTPYATCPLPPKQNILPVAIDAGEKDFANH